MLKSLTLKHWIVGALVLILSFTITLWLTKPEAPPETPPEDMIKLLAGAAVTDEASLNAAARTAGLQYSTYVTGNVDALSRVEANQVSIAGWAVETLAATARGAPINVMAFSGGRRIFGVQTKGERPDVTSALNLSEEAAKNVAFEGRLECSPGEKLLIVGATLSGTYALLATKSCP